MIWGGGGKNFKFNFFLINDSRLKKEPLVDSEMRSRGEGVGGETEV